MNFLKKLFGKKEEPINNYNDFWNWFLQHKKTFFDVVKSEENIEKEFFDKLSPRLQALNDGYYFVTGMYNEHTVELILTADGNPNYIVFVEDLVEQAPEIEGWKFTALKPALNIEDVNIQMRDLKFNKGNLFFYSNDQEKYPDEIDIIVVHEDLTEENKQQVVNGVYIFLDNFLGELDFVNNIDNLEIIGKSEAQKELIPIEKLKDFLTWRQKEFIEKYEGVGYDTSDDEHAIMEAKLQSGKMLIAVLNTKLLDWDSKASHPWLAVLTIKYDGGRNNGMPANADFEKMQAIEDELEQMLIDKDGYLHVGRQTANNEREVYYACKDFRKPSKAFFELKKKYGKDFEMESDIYKDKYWQTLERFNNHK